MGSYNKEYEKYYRKINKTRKTSPNHEVNFKTKGSYKRREKDSLGKYVIKEVVFSSILGFFIFSSFFLMGQVENEFLVGLSRKFKEVISTDGYYKNLNLNESKIVATISSGIKDGFNLENSNLKKEPKQASEEKVSENSGEVSAFNNFQVIEKESIDFLKESKVIPFNGEVKTLENNNLKKKNLYLSGSKGEVKSLLKGIVSEVKNENGTYTVKMNYYDDLEVLYHNLEEVAKKEGDSIEEGDKIGISSENEKVKGVIIQVLFKNEYVNPEESMRFLGDKQ
ncbi:peptidoglycan DD-metalloendopeptidase family protein [Clostridium perfringens]|uniref:peptidoglycan DD-metalloendopeptidase family protein n=1 Tax=Clostridium perfringens TaxID=1502 RepID=UPI0029118AFE|nr:peptidoglycan DD-metalloendopeptidase family protein [Clostridium perfringens]EJT6170418.1 peptidoglycan DD-metalloendopeptidase family protein [Clostridium perfringens]EJT6541142.1 peptidoglycan DD-metalloendopeptidase family protein [Clostridium perfringens]EJT6566149.1 peptidoglycan DD-metalloendopeptidase family protein [Clostridium perfringens]MBS5993296.1 peptidoglycan DD-metalloendopeptidase family protein [Clostridium perfringens]MDM0995939.1 peptidoglycan DD-metalloendopeptidase fa